MPAKQFHLPKRVEREIFRFPLRIRLKINQAFIKLKANPISGVKLKGELGYSYKFRVGDYRIIYKFDKKNSLLEIIKVEHWQGVYK